MMSTNPNVLVVFYSLEGNTRLIAEAIATATRGELLELKPAAAMKATGFMKYFWGGRQVMMKETPELLPLTQNPNDYDLIFIGTPVWAFSFAPALNSFFKNVKIAGKKIALFCCNEGGRGKTFENMKAALTGNDIIGEMEFIAPLKKNTVAKNEAKAQQWAEKLIH